jgi:DNA helicase HerA-like ATPase
MVSYSQADIEQEIHDCERQFLTSIKPRPVDPKDILARIPFVRVLGVSNFWQSDLPVNYLQHVVDFIVSAQSYNGYLTFILTGNPNQVEVYLALEEAKVLDNLLYSAFPGITLKDNPALGLDASLQARLKNVGMLTGIPSQRRSGSEDDEIEPDFYQLERIIRGMRDAAWIYVVKAYPCCQDDLVVERQTLLGKIADLASQTKGQIQKSTQKSHVRTKQETITASEMMGGEVYNRHAEYVVELLEQELKRIETALSLGRWQVAVYFGAEKQSDAQRLSSLLKGTLAGPDSRPEPIRVHSCQSGKKISEPEQFHTYITSEELALLIALPREEAPGYALNDLAAFDVDFSPSEGKKVELGRIQWNGSDSGHKYKLPVDELTRHGVIFGVTGSGKTTTLLSLLHQLRNNTPPIPFLVIEPAKTEYRSLLGSLEKGLAKGPIPDLQIYTLGSDTIAPFRLNPFEFDLGDKPGSVSILSHIDFLKAVFNAAFILYAPMPYVLETALHEVYEDKGWNLATETNIRLDEDTWRQKELYPIFPTLTDLYNKVDEVTSRLGYESRVEQDVIAGLKARIGALRLGAKGLMLDTPRGVPFSQLLHKPVVLEMEYIGNDDEKTFLIGLIFARLYGYRRLQAAEGKLNTGLQHILVVEEAHRLLKNVNTQVDTESSNLRAQAIETFVNMLSEVRYYGQGVLVAEQIPSKLTPDVIKNTNLKVVHRLLAEDDRQLLGTAMNMTEAQTKSIAILQPGEALAFAGGDDHPIKLKMDDYKKIHHLEMPLSSQLPDFVERYTSLSGYLLAPDFASYNLRIARFGGPDPIPYQAAKKHLGRWDTARVWSRIITRIVFSRSMLPESIDNLRQRIASDPDQLSPNKFNESLIMQIVLGAIMALDSRGRDNNWSYSIVESMRVSLTNGLVRMARFNDAKAGAPDLDRFARAYETNQKREWGPYPGCHSCRAICFYRSDVRRLFSSVELGHIKNVLTSNDYDSEESRYEALRSTLRGITKQWMGNDVAEVDDIGYCLALVALPIIGYDEYEQAIIGAKLSKVMLP